MEREIIEKEILKEVFKKRSEDSHKYDWGYVLIIGGSQLYSGSPALSAMAAMRVGIDLTLIIAPERAANIIASFSPDLIAYPLEGSDIELKNLPTLIALTNSAKKTAEGKIAVVIGGGIGRDEETQKTIREYLKFIDIPCVIDADAIWAIANKKEILKEKKVILTPHSAEYFILTGKKINQMSQEEKETEVQNTAKDLNCTILLKGNPDIIASPNKLALNKTGNPYMTVGGTGDTLAGICGAFLSQGFGPFLSASVAAFLNGVAGDMAAEKFGPGLLATDIVKSIPKVIKKYKYIYNN